MPRIEAKRLSIGYGDHEVVTDLDLMIPDKKITTIIGPNGCGKSTILKTLARLLKPSSGTAFLDGKAIQQQSTKEVAKKVAILPQAPHAPEGLTVKELVSYGRSPYQKGFGRLQTSDWEVIYQALEQTHLIEEANRPVHSLSGGQRQRVWIAMALVQETDILLLDEPTTYLDMAHQLEVLQVLETLNKDHHRTIVMVLHDLNHAARFADYMVAVHEGVIVQKGTAEEVLTEKVLRDVFQVDATIVQDPKTNKPVCLTYQLLE